MVVVEGAEDMSATLMWTEICTEQWELIFASKVPRWWGEIEDATRRLPVVITFYALLEAAEGDDEPICRA